MYCLEAVIATGSVLAGLAREEAHIMPLGQHVSLLPMTDEFVAAVTVAGGARLGGFHTMPAGFDRALAACSASGPVAYVEADFFGGTGTQVAQVWDAGRVALGPLHLAEGEPLPPDGGPLSRALRRLGVTKGGHFDEFDAVGLGRFRATEDWLDLPRNTHPGT